METASLGSAFWYRRVPYVNLASSPLPRRTYFYSLTKERELGLLGEMY